MRLPGPRLGGEEPRAVEPREEGVPDAGRDGGVRGERLVEGELLLPAVPGLERLVEEAGAVDERTQLVGGGAVAGDLVLRRAEVGHGEGERGRQLAMEEAVASWACGGAAVLKKEVWESRDH